MKLKNSNNKMKNIEIIRDYFNDYHNNNEKQPVSVLYKRGFTRHLHDVMNL